MLHSPRDQAGIAMVTTILVVFVMSLLAVGMLEVSNRNSTATAHNRSWGQAVHVAESGVHEAIAYLQQSGGVVPAGAVSGTTADGSYQYRVVAMSRHRYQIDATGTVGTTVSLRGSRRLRVLMAPPSSFQYALFSLSDVTTKNNNLVCGDIWANTYVVVYQNDSVMPGSAGACPAGSSGSGSVTAATGYVELQTNSTIAGDAWSGGNNSSSQAVTLANGAHIGGSAKASSSTPGCADDPTHAAYKVANSGSISGSVTTWGTISGGGSSGTQSPLTCTTASATKNMPLFSFNPANYAAGTLQQYTFPTDYAAFNSYLAANKNNLSGTFYIVGGDATTPITLSGVSVGGDLTIVATDAPIDAAQGIGSVAGSTSDKLVVLASYYTAPPTNCSTNGGNPGDCAIGFKNNFQPSSSDLSGGDNTAVLLYAPNGPIAFKNNAEFQGAVYGNNIQVKNNMNVIYDPRVEQVIGFGPVTLDVTRWLECNPGPVTTSSC